MDQRTWLQRIAAAVPLIRSHCPGWSDPRIGPPAAVELIDGVDEVDVRLISDGPLFANK